MKIIPSEFNVLSQILNATATVSSFNHLINYKSNINQPFFNWFVPHTRICDLRWQGPSHSQCPLLANSICTIQCQPRTFDEEVGKSYLKIH